jgi:hypothetical protein
MNQGSLRRFARMMAGTTKNVCRGDERIRQEERAALVHPKANNELPLTTTGDEDEMATPEAATKSTHKRFQNKRNSLCRRTAKSYSEVDGKLKNSGNG